MTQDAAKSSRAELQRRWRAMLQDGSLVALGTEGRLVALYVLHMADWSSCEVRFSMRRVARFLSVQPTTVRRGVGQMVSAGILEVLEKQDGSGWTRFVVCTRAQGVRTPDTPCAHPAHTLCAPRAQGVRTPDTGCAHSAHKVCAPRTQGVRGVRTLCVRNSLSVSGSSFTTTDRFIEAAPTGGDEPPAACQEGNSGKSAAG